MPQMLGLKLTGEGRVEQLNPHGHGFIVHGGSMFQCVGVRPSTNSAFFEEICMFVACLSVWHIGPDVVCLFFSKESSQAVRCCSTFGLSWYLGCADNTTRFKGTLMKQKGLGQSFYWNGVVLLWWSNHRHGLNGTTKHPYACFRKWLPLVGKICKYV